MKILTLSRSILNSLIYKLELYQVKLLVRILKRDIEALTGLKWFIDQKRKPKGPGSYMYSDIEFILKCYAPIEENLQNKLMEMESGAFDELNDYNLQNYEITIKTD